jgi:hypothetical protein
VFVGVSVFVGVGVCVGVSVLVGVTVFVGVWVGVCEVIVGVGVCVGKKYGWDVPQLLLYNIIFVVELGTIILNPDCRSINVKLFAGERVGNTWARFAGETKS